MKNKKNIILLSGIILTLILTISVSYAFFYYVGEGEEISLTSGSILINFSEGTNYISLGNSYPKSDIMGKIDPNYYDFTISGSKGENDDILYEIQIEPEEGNTLDEKYVKVYLTDQNNEYVTPNPKKISELKTSEYNGNKIIYDKYINKVDESNNYRLRVWIDESYTENISKTFNFKIYLYSVNGKVEFIYDQIAKLNGTNGIVAVNIDGDLASDGDTIREYRYSGSAKYCTYTIDENTYRLNVDSDICPSACYSGSSLYRYDNEYISVLGNNCNTEVVANDTKPLNGNVKNYVWYNNEMWRIIGAFCEETDNGTVANLVKIVRDEPLLQEEVPSTYTYNGTQMIIKDTKNSNLKYANIYWNHSKYFSQTNYNDWTKSSLQYYLNDEANIESFYNKINTMYKKMIETVTYYLGSIDSIYSAKAAYMHERGKNVWTNNPEKWIGKIGLMYPSDYGYASNRSNWNIYLGTYYSLDNTGSKDNWCNDDKTIYEWLISTAVNYSYFAMDMPHSGAVSSLSVYGYHTDIGAASPVLYLKSNIRIIDGDGSYDNPYQIGW